MGPRGAGRLSRLLPSRAGSFPPPHAHAPRPALPQHGKTYTDTSSLRYGRLMIMTDQDQDGSHIKGLLINFLHAHFPSLLKARRRRRALSPPAWLCSPGARAAAPQPDRRRP